MEELWNGGGEREGGGHFGVGETGVIFGEGGVSLESLKDFFILCNLFSEIIWKTFNFLNLLHKISEEERNLFEKEWENY